MTGGHSFLGIFDRGIIKVGGHPFLRHRFAYQSKATPFTSEACETNHSQVKKGSKNGKLLGDSTWHLCTWGHCVDIRPAIVLICDARQKMSEGKRSPVKTRLTRPVATPQL